jgi:hypothetical protein
MEFVDHLKKQLHDNEAQLRSIENSPGYRLVQHTREGEVDFTDHYKSQLVKAIDDYRQAITHLDV